MPNYVRLIIGTALVAGMVALFVFGHWGWAILVLLLALIVFITFFFHEYMLIAQYYLRKENLEKAEQWLRKISNYEKQLVRVQHGYYFLLLGLVESRNAPLKSEKYFKRALSLGVHMDHNVALANLSLAGVMMAKRNKREAERYLQLAKKADKKKLMAEQIKMMQDQMTMLNRTQIRYR